MAIQKIIIELIHNNIIHSEPKEYEELKGGTVSKLYLFNIDSNKCVVKLNEPQVIESEAFFLKYYKETHLLPRLLFVEPSYRYIVYSFIDGSTNFVRKNKKMMLKTLVKGLLNNYKPAPKDIGWGWVDQPIDSWQSFLLNEIVEARKIIDSRLDNADYHFVCNLVKKNRVDSKPFLLHGDCGVHNFIFNGRQLSGVIDPTPVIGDPLYDLNYAFVSSPDDLTKETIESGVRHLTAKRDMNHSDLYEQVIICLYLRLGTCIKHHPNDFEEYLKAWYYWKDVIKNSF
jgi:fructosamine-3-kinase